MEDKRVFGTVKWFNPKKGFGFINSDESPDIDIFVHYSYITMEGYKTLNKGQKVSYKVVKSDRGPQAHEVMSA